MQKILNLKHGTQKAMFFVFFLLCSAVMMAQNKVSGTVLDATGEPWNKQWSCYRFQW